jgi:hypothetical protein
MMDLKLFLMGGFVGNLHYQRLHFSILGHCEIQIRTRASELGQHPSPGTGRNRPPKRGDTLLLPLMAEWEAPSAPKPGPKVQQMSLIFGPPQNDEAAN